jgi:hypothetical protein
LGTQNKNRHEPGNIGKKQEIYRLWPGNIGKRRKKETPA